MSTDREVLVELLGAVDRFAGYAPLAAGGALRRAADHARRHLLLVEAADGDCAARISAARDAAYAAGRAREADARPDARQGWDQ